MLPSVRQLLASGALQHLVRLVRPCPCWAWDPTVDAQRARAPGRHHLVPDQAPAPAQTIGVAAWQTAAPLSSAGAVMLPWVRRTAAGFGAISRSSCLDADQCHLTWC